MGKGTLENKSDLTF